MANDGSLLSKLEQFVADTLAALTSGGSAVFKTADVWRHQLAAGGSGFESLGRHSPCAFVSYTAAEAAREGGNELREVIEFAILIGVEHKNPGTARIGSTNVNGTSKLRDLVIALFESKHPGESLTCDEIYYTGDREIFDAPTQHVIELHFETSKMTPEAT